MTQNLILLLSVVWFSSAQAATKHFSIDAGRVQAVDQRGFTKFSFADFNTTNQVGAPELPVKSWLVHGHPSDIDVQLAVSEVQTQKGVRPFPVQPQDCRCEDQKNAFSFDEATYNAPAKDYTLTYLGDFRGTPITRVDVPLATYDGKTQTVVFKTELTVTTNVPDFSFGRAEYKDYLIIVPEALADGVADFATYRADRGYNVLINRVTSVNSDLASLSAMIKEAYERDGADFVILVGDETTLPMFKVSTSGSSQTPTDLKHFTMGGAADYVQDMFFSRIAAKTVDGVRQQLAKSIEYEQNLTLPGRKKIIGIASNEGSNPSDREYVTSVQESLIRAKYAESASFFYQNDTTSTPTVLNQKFNDGAFWLTYLGHGSGTSWPSMKQSYNVPHIIAMNNVDSTKPVIIDVACMNGKLVTNYLGASFMKTEGNAHGAAAYFGGTVNISWHPPAVMARGIAFEHETKHFKHLGEALLAGQLYLAANWTNQAQIIDNFEWYHLQGDPGMSVEF